MTAIRELADEAQNAGVNASDTNGVVRYIVEAHGISFLAWLCVCCELADRDARKHGFQSQFHRASALTSKAA